MKNIKLQISQEMFEQILLAIKRDRETTGSIQTVVGFIREAIKGKIIAEQINQTK